MQRSRHIFLSSTSLWHSFEQCLFYRLHMGDLEAVNKSVNAHDSKCIYHSDRFSSSTVVHFVDCIGDKGEFHRRQVEACGRHRNAGDSKRTFHANSIQLSIGSDYAHRIGHKDGEEAADSFVNEEYPTHILNAGTFSLHTCAHSSYCMWCKPEVNQREEQIHDKSCNAKDSRHISHSSTSS